MALHGALLRCAAVVLLLVGVQAPAKAQLFNTGPWSGLYVGVHGGYSWENADTSPIDGTALGVQAGYNLQLGVALLGIEADYSWSQAEGAATTPGLTVTGSIDSMWSVRGRLGAVLANTVLLYGTAGYGGFDVGVKGTIGTVPFTGSASFEAVVVGGGAELLLTRNLMLRAEALHFIGDGSTLTAGGDTGVTMVRAGISYKF